MPFVVDIFEMLGCSRDSEHTVKGVVASYHLMRVPSSSRTELAAELSKSSALRE